MVEYLKGLKDEYNNKSDDFKTTFMEKSGLTEAEVMEMLTYGSGPKLLIENLDKNDKVVNGQHVASLSESSGKLSLKDGKGLIKIDDNVLDMFKNSKTIPDKGAGRIMLESTLFHEGTHYGNVKKHGNGNGSFGESGKAFERQAYGLDISRGNVRRYWDSKYGFNNATPKPLMKVR